MTQKHVRCGRCSNNCQLTINDFGGGRRFITGNRCEKGAGHKKQKTEAPNLFKKKNELLFNREVLSPDEAPRGTVGIPRALNMYENYPFWHAFFTRLGFSVQLSDQSSKKTYQAGIESMPSESVCYPAKMSHGHVMNLIDRDVDFIWMPCVRWERKEDPTAGNCYNCPIVMSYPTALALNIDEIREQNIEFLYPFVPYHDKTELKRRLYQVLAVDRVADAEAGRGRVRGPKITRSEVDAAVNAAFEADARFHEDIQTMGEEALKWVEDHGGHGIVLAGRPYHNDPEINHALPELISSFGFAVFTEDSLAHLVKPERPIRVVDQWMYHSRLYAVARFVTMRNDLDLIQLNSFGCGLDALTTDQVQEILEASGKIYTVLKIDEVSNLGAARIRIRSLLAAVAMRRERGIHSTSHVQPFERVYYTKEMQKQHYTILAPQMSPIHFDILEPIFRHHGYNLRYLQTTTAPPSTRAQVRHNDACYPSITAVGQLMEAVTSGRYDTDHLALIMSQTAALPREQLHRLHPPRAQKAGLEHIPVISLNANGMETNEGFRISPSLLLDAAHGIVLGDLLMRCLYRVRPYELEKDSANALHRKWRDICIDSLTSEHPKYRYAQLCRGIVEDFDALPIDETLKKPRVASSAKSSSNTCHLPTTMLSTFWNARAQRRSFPIFSISLPPRSMSRTSSTPTLERGGLLRPAPSSAFRHFSACAAPRSKR